MTPRLVICFRWHDPDTESSRYLAAAERIFRRVTALGGEAVSWSADSYAFGIEASATPAVLRLAISLLSEARTHAVGIACRELGVDAAGRSWGFGLVLAEALAEAASPGEILLDPTLPEVQAGLLATLGTIPVRVRGERVGGALLLPGACPNDGFRLPEGELSSDDALDLELKSEPSGALTSHGLQAAPEDTFGGPALGQRAPRKPTTRKLPPLPAPELRSIEPRSPMVGKITAAGVFFEERERPSVLAALRSGDSDTLLAKAAELRHKNGDSTIAESLEGLAMIVRGEAPEGVKALRECALQSERHSGPRRVRARLALAVGYSLTGDRFESILAGLGALARARECGDARGELASAQLLANLSRSDGEAQVSAAWSAAVGR
jgi:hypothetical protein